MKVAAWLAALVIGSMAVFELVVEPLVGARFVRRAIEGVLPWPDARVTLAGAELSGIRRLTITDLHVSLAARGNTLSIDTLSVAFSPRAVFGSPPRLGHVRVVGAAIEGTREGERWAWLDDAGSTSRSRETPLVIVDRLELARVSLAAMDTAGGTVIGMTAFGATADSLRVGGGSAGQVQRFDLRLHRPGWIDEWLAIGGGAELADGAWDVRSVELSDPAWGRLSVAGSIADAREDGAALDLRLEGDGIRVAGFHPAVANLLTGDPVVAVAATVRGTASRPRVDADLRFDGGGLVHVEAALDRTTEPDSLRVSVDLEGVDASRVRTGWTAGPFEGRLEARLAFPDSATPEGSMTIDLRSTRRDPSITVRGRAGAIGGELLVELDARSGTRSADLSGRVRALDSPPTYELTLEAESELPLPAFLVSRVPALGGRWEGSLRVSGSGFDPDSAVADLAASFGGGGTRAPDSGARGSASGTLRAGRLLFEGMLEAAGGATVSATGAVPLRNAREGWELERLAWASVPLSPWLGLEDLGASAGRARLSAMAGGVEGVVHVEEVSDGRLAGTTAALEVQGASGRAGLSGSAAIAGGQVEIERVSIGSGALEELSIAFADLSPEGWLPGLEAARLRGRLALSRPPRGDSVVRPAPAAPRPAVPLGGRVDLTGSRLGGGELEGGADLVLAYGELRIDGELRSASEVLRVVGRFQPGEDRSFEIEDARFVGFTPSLWLGPVAPPGRVSGSLAGVLRGAGDPMAAEARMQLRLDSADLGPLALGRSQAMFVLGEGRASLRETYATLRRRDGSAGGRVELDVEAHLQPSGSWAGSGSGLLASPDASDRDITPDSTHGVADTLGIAFAFTTGEERAEGSWRVDIDGHGSAFGLEVDTLVAGVTGSEGSTSVERLEVRGETFTVEGRGRLPAVPGSEADLAVTGEVGDLGLFAGLLGYDHVAGSATVSLRSSGTRADARHEVRLDLDGIELGGLATESVRVSSTIRGDTRGWLSSLSVDLDVVGPGLVLFGPEASPSRLGLGASPDPQRGSARLAWSRSEPSVMRVTDLAMLLDGQRWTLDRPAEIDWAEGVSLSDHVLASGSRRLVVSGRFDRAGEQDLTLVARELPILIWREDALASAWLIDTALGVSGPAASPSVRIDGTLGGIASGGATFVGEWDAQGLRLDLEARQERGGLMTVQGSVPVRPSLVQGAPLVPITDAPTDLRIALQGFDVAGLATLAPFGVSGVRGRLDADAHFTGPGLGASGAGGAQLTGFGLIIEPTGTTVASERLALEFAGGEARITEARFSDGAEGSATLTGRVFRGEEGEPGLDLSVDLRSFRVVDNRSLEATVSGPLRLTGQTRALVIGGDVVVSQGTYSVTASSTTSGLAEVELSEADYAEIERRFGVTRETEAIAPPLWETVTVDLGVTATSNVWARSAYDPALAAEIEGALRLSKEPYEPLTMHGTLSVVEGRSVLEEFGRRFDLSRGVATFDGPPESVELTARATYEVEDAVIWVDATRDQETGLRLVLGSDPGMSESDIVSYLATGRRATDIERFGESDRAAADIGAGFALSGLRSNVEEVTRETLGLDVVQIEQDGLNGLTFTLGQYVAPRLFVGVRQPMAFSPGNDRRYGINETEMNAEYRLRDWLKTTVSGGRGLFKAFLKVERGY